MVDEINAGLVKRNGVGGGKKTDIGHAGCGGMGITIAVNGDINHGSNVGDTVAEELMDAGGGITHGGDEGKLSGGHIIAFGIASAVDIFFAVGRGAADGELFEGATEAAHGVAFEVGEDKERIVVS